MTAAHRLIVVLALMAAALPSAASAGTVTVRSERIVDRSGTGTLARLTYTARPGERNRLVVRFHGRSATVSDRAGVIAGRGCSRRGGRGRARCRLAEGVRLRVSLGDRNDRAAVSGALPIGDLDQFSQASISGGAGADRLTYLGTGAAELLGGGGDDHLRARAFVTTFRGGQGNDRMIGGPGQDRFDEGRRSSGADTMVGATSKRPGKDTVDYGRRRRAVAADLEGDPDDGELGEGDRIGTDVEDLVGGSGGDRLTGSADDNQLVGNAGSDILWGGEGDDGLSAGRLSTIGGHEPEQVFGGPGDDELMGSGLLDPGPGRDIVTGGLGNDRILARDDATDRIECYQGADEIELDRLDWFGQEDLYSRCERVSRIGSPVAVLVGLNAPGTEIPSRRDRPVAVPEFGCPGDAPAACAADVRIVVGGSVVGATAIVLPPGESGYRPFRIARDTWRRAIDPSPVPVQATLVITARDPDGQVVEQSIPVRLT